METSFYLPLLKSKAGEFKALENLNPKLKKKIVPLFDVTPMEYDHDEDAKPKTIEEHLVKFCKKIIKSWPHNSMFLDTSMVNKDKPVGSTAIEYIYAVLATKGISPMPVLYPNSSTDLIESVQSILLMYDVSEIAIRVTIEDITSSEFEERLGNILTELDLSYDKCHIIFDLKDADFSQMEDFTDGVIAVLTDFPNLRQWKTFTIAGGAFPGMAKIKTEVELVPRNDWKLFNSIIEQLKGTKYNRPLNFGDYSIVSPSYFEFDPKKMSTSANIRYTHNDVWFVIKGKALKKSADWQQYYLQAATIVKSKYYLGEDFSFGDKHLKKCSKKETTTGNPNVWIQMGTNHHFTKVLTDLFAKSA